METNVKFYNPFPKILAGGEVKETIPLGDIITKAKAGEMLPFPEKSRVFQEALLLPSNDPLRQEYLGLLNLAEVSSEEVKPLMEQTTHLLTNLWVRLDAGEEAEKLYLAMFNFPPDYQPSYSELLAAAIYLSWLNDESVEATKRNDILKAIINDFINNK